MHEHTAILSNAVGTHVSLASRALVNDASLGLYRIYEHVQAHAPKVLQCKTTVERETTRIGLTIGAAEDMQKVLADLHKCKSFNQVNTWLRQAIEDA